MIETFKNKDKKIYLGIGFNTFIR